MSRWEIRRTGRHRWEATPAAGCLDRMILGAAVVTVTVGAASRVLPALAAWAVDHAGTVTLGVLVAWMLAAVVRGT